MRGMSGTGHGHNTASGGVFAALAVALLYLACVIPSGRIGVVALAGLMPVGALLAAGKAAGYLCWAASGLLGLILLPDKVLALTYLLFLGFYPLIKSKIESKRNVPFEIVVKLLYFNVMLTVFSLLFGEMFFSLFSTWMTEGSWLLYLAGNAVFVLYDIGLTRVITIFIHRTNGKMTK